MARKDPYDDPKKPNLLVLTSIMVAGKAIKKGTVVPKSAIEKKADWKNLVHMDPPRLEETDLKVGEPTKKAPAKKTTLAMPGSE
jgi:hypothetical protein